MSAVGPRLTQAEVGELAAAIASALIDEPAQAGTVAAVLARRMNEAPTRAAQDRAGAHVLEQLDALTSAEAT